MLDALLAEDPLSRCACEVTCEPGLVRVMGEITTCARPDYEAIVRAAIRDVGYTRPEYGFCADTVRVEVSLRRQSADIALSVDRSLEAKVGGGEALGAGDQGMMFGYACDETESLMPAPIELAHDLTFRLAQCRRTGELPWLRPDGKAQVTLEYAGGVPTRVHTLVISAQHDPDVDMDELRAAILQKVVRQAVPERLLDARTLYYVNPTGRFVLGGPAADTGLTGRKIIVDTYGGYARHGGGAFSGKDPTKVDRSACYMARYLAKNAVAAGLARRCEIQLGYAIGVAQPVSVRVETFGTGRLADEQLCRLLLKETDLSPAGIIARFDLRRPRYTATSAYGHFGAHASEQPWEKTDLAGELRRMAAPCA